MLIALAVVGLPLYARANASQRARIVFSGYAKDTTLNNFPLLVKLSEAAVPNFKYSAAGTRGEGLRFLADVEGELKSLPFDVEVWDESGVSLVWVLVPEFKANGEIFLVWGDEASGIAAGSTESVWSEEFAGVWHFNETIASEVAGATVSKDATGRGFAAIPQGSKNGDRSLMTSAAGVIGNARTIDQRNTNYGNYLQVTDIGDLGSEFTVSFWVKCDGYTGSATWLMRRETVDGEGGFMIEHSAVGKTSVKVRGSGSDAATARVFEADPNPSAGYIFVTFVYHGTSVSVYANGASQTVSGSIGAVKYVAGDPLYIGGAFAGDDYYSLNGAMDELRIAKGASSADRVYADYQTVAADNFVTYSSESVTNRWVTEPVLINYIWPLGSTDMFVSGVPLFGGTRNTYSNLTTGVVWNILPDEPGSYHLVHRALVDADLMEAFEYDIEIVTDRTSYALDSSRVLLMNRDDNSLSPIPHQGYAAIYSDAVVYWERGQMDEDVVETDAAFNLQPYNFFQMKWGNDSSVPTAKRGEKLWRLEYCRGGNTFPKDSRLTAWPEGALKAQNFLPFSSTSRRNSADTRAQLQLRQVGQVVMQNRIGSQVISPCYDEGIGEIYFDAVNGFTSMTNVLEVSIATGSNATMDPDATTVWNPVAMEKLTIKGGEVVARSTETELLLDMNYDADGGSVKDFYRFRLADTTYINYRKPIRFRIRRLEENGRNGDELDGEGLCLVDNIIASEPCMSVELKSCGNFIPGESGVEALGQRAGFSAAYPAATSTNLYPRVDVNYLTNGVPTDTSDFIVDKGLTIAYRWRYLDQSIGAWHTNTFTAVDEARTHFRAPKVEDDVLANGPGDIEYHIEAEINAPAYGFVDYTGLEIETPSDWDEAVRKVSLASPWEEQPWSGRCGFVTTNEFHNHFIRLRKGISEFGSMKVIVAYTNGTTKEVSMELIGDNKWRGLLETPTNSCDRAKFYFRGYDQAVEDPDYPGAEKIKVTTDGVPFAPNLGSGQTVVESFPCSASLTRDEVTMAELPIDALTGYLEFTIDTSSLILNVARCDYQNFDLWDDAYNQRDFYKGSTSVTNSVTPSVTNFTANFMATGWNPSIATNRAWQEEFQLESGQGTAGFEKLISFTSAQSPRNWTAEYGMWTYGYLAVEKAAGDKFALQMEGCGKGNFTYMSASNSPNGLDTIDFSARLGQFINFSDFAYDYSYLSGGATNYTIRTQAAFDEMSTEESSNYTGEPSISLVGYYRPNWGCYEVRFTRPAPGQIKIALYRWNRKAGGGFVATQLSPDSWKWTGWDPGNKTNLMTMPFLTNKLKAFGSEVPANAHTECFLTIRTEADGAVAVIAGFSSKKVSGSGTKLGSSDYYLLGYRDKDTENAIDSGTYGFLMSNCPGVIYKPAFSEQFLEDSTSTSSDNDYDEFVNKTKDSFAIANGKVIVSEPTKPAFVPLRDKISAKYSWSIPSRMQAISDDVNWGLETSDEVAQTVALQISPAGNGQWQTVEEVKVSSFVNERHSIQVHSTEKCDVRLQMMGLDQVDRTDVVLDRVEITQWMGSSNLENRDSGSGNYKDFVYTGGWLTTNITVNAGGNETTYRELDLWATRNPTNVPTSLRTPLMSQGLGMMNIAWRNADANLRLLFQVATNEVGTGTLKGITQETYDNTDNWVTLEVLDFSLLKPYERVNGSHNFYANLRAPVSGVMRVVIDPTVAGYTTGGFTLTEAYAHDLPAFDYRSWTGWNLRTTGWVSDDVGGKADQWADIFDAKSGLSGILNNTATGDSLIDPPTSSYARNPPYVQSPTMMTNCIGYVTFDARLYDPDGFNPATESSAVTIWAVRMVPLPIALRGRKSAPSKLPIGSLRPTPTRCRPVRNIGLSVSASAGAQVWIRLRGARQRIRRRREWS